MSFGADGSAVVETEPSGLDYGLTQGGVSAYAVTAPDAVEGLGNFASEIWDVALDIGVHIVDIDFWVSENRRFPKREKRKQAEYCPEDVSEHIVVMLMKKNE